MKERSVIQGGKIVKCNQDSKKCQYLVLEIIKITDERETKKNKDKKEKR